MNRNELRKTWSRWLDRRPIAPPAEDDLVAALTSDDAGSSELVNDLIIHRQLQALERFSQEGDSFSTRMLQCFNSASTSKDSRSFQWLNINNAPKPAEDIPADFHGIWPVDVAPRTRTTARQKLQRTSWLIGGVLCAPILIFGVYLAIVQNFQNGNGQSAKQKPVETLPDDKQSWPTLPKASPSNSDTPDAAPVGPLVVNNDDTSPVPPNPFVPANPAPGTGSQPDDLPVNATFASVRELKPCRWAGESPAPSQDSHLASHPIGRQTLELLSGNAVIQFEDGTQLEIEGPSKIDLIDSRHILFLFGDLHGDVRATNKTGFVIDSLAGRFVPSSDSGFQMRVVPESRAEVNVQRGSIEAQPWHGHIQSAPVSLSKAGFDTLVVEGTTNDAPGRATFRNRQGQLEGWVKVNGRLLKSGNPQFLDDVFDKAKNRFAESPEQLESEWSHLLAVVHEDKQQPGQKHGTPGKHWLPENGGDDVDEMMRLIQGMLDQSTERTNQPDHPMGDGSFEGVLNINGQITRFDSKEKFDEARTELLGTFAESLRHFRK